MRWLALAVSCGLAWGQGGVDPDYAKAWRLSGQGRWGETIPILKRMIERGSRFAPAYAALAAAFNLTGDRTGGEKYFQTLAEREPLNGAACYGMLMLRGMDNADEGQRLCSRCAALDPSIYECYEALAYNLLQRSPEGAKVARLEALLPMHPETAESLATLSGFHRWQGRKVEAVSAAEGAVKLSSSRADRGMLARSEFELADALAMEPGAERETAIEHAEAACAAAMESGDPDLELNICGKAARNYSRDAASRDERLTALIDEATGLSHHRWEGTLRSWRAEDLSRAGRAEEALEESRLAAEAMDRTGDPDNSGLVWRLRGEMQARLGDADGAALSMEEALRAAERQGSEAARSFVLSKLTVIHNQAGRGLEAIRTAEEAVRLFRALGMDRQAGAELSDVGWAYLTLGDYETAVRYFRESLESGRWFQDASEVARNSNFLAEAYLESGQPGKARVVLLAATESLKMAKDRNFYLRFHTLLGEAHSRLGDGAAAGRAFGEALATAREVKDTWLEAGLDERLGRHFLRSGDLARAERSFEDSLAVAERSSLLKHVANARAGLAEVWRRRGQPEKALESLKLAVGALEQMRADAPGPELRTGLLGKNWQVYEELIDTLDVLHRRRPAAGFDREALTYSERGRARVLLDLLAESRGGLTAGLTAAETERQKELRLKVSAATVRMKAEETPATRSAVAAAEEALRAWETGLRVENAKYRELRYPEPLDAGGIARVAAERGVTIVEYWLGRRSSRVWVAGRGGVRSAALAPRAAVEGPARKLLAALSRHPAGAAAEEYRGPAAELYRLLIAPVKAQLGSGTRVVIVADGILHYVPFETLIGEDGRFLIEDVTIGYAPSASVFGQLGGGRGEPAKRELLAVGNPDFGGRAAAPGDAAGVTRGVYAAAGLRLSPLPESEREVRTIAGLFGAGQEKVLVGGAASEAAVKGEALDEYRRVHLATHALIDERAPARSGIVLSLRNTGAEDGVLLVGEIMGLKLDAEVVTLSGCETGLGGLVRGEGMVGFTRAFLFAGAKRLVVSLWPVNDRATPDFMAGFYRAMRDGRATADALREAKLGMLRGRVEAYRHPYFWGAFVAVGGW